MILKIGLPHSDIHGSKGARPSPQLFAACHVLHRLLAPRHPPDALFNASFSVTSFTHAQKTNQMSQTKLIASRFLLDPSLKQISCLDQCRTHMSPRTPEPHTQPHWHTIERSTSHARAQNIRDREPREPSAFKRAKRPSARVRPR